MNILNFATSNKWKFWQARDCFAKEGIKLEQFKVELPESRSEDVVEIAKEKVEYAFTEIGKPVFVIDAAFYIKALGDFPKTYVKFAEKYLGAEGILKLLKGEKDRRWEFPNVLYYKDKNQEKYFIGTVKGEIIEKVEHNYDKKVRDFDRIQRPEGFKKTFAEMNDKELRMFDEKVWRPTVFDEFIDWIEDLEAASSESYKRRIKEARESKMRYSSYAVKKELGL